MISNDDPESHESEYDAKEATNPLTDDDYYDSEHECANYKYATEHNNAATIKSNSSILKMEWKYLIDFNELCAIFKDRFCDLRAEDGQESLNETQQELCSKEYQVKQ